MLLFRTKGKSLAALGAILTLLMLAIDTFFQQVVELPERWILQDQSRVPKVIQFNPFYAKEYEHGYSGVMLQDDAEVIQIARKFFFENGTQPLSSGNGAHVPSITCRERVIRYISAFTLRKKYGNLYPNRRR